LAAIRAVYESLIKSADVNALVNCGLTLDCSDYFGLKLNFWSYWSYVLC